ncbi:MAG: RsmB/NOP family class I SAM-dependent RNA methyltransferase [Kiritimatiellia bacterium]|nr:RsmB/NOP family class I SAM-dependent RNA methyltransferase [Kiritimatiellia bacterium]
MNKIPSNVARRQAAVCLALIREIDQAVVNNRQPADQVLAHIYRQHREYGARDRRFFSNAVFSWFRWRGWLKTPTNENAAAAILLDTAEIPPQMEYMIADSVLKSAGLKPLGALNLEDKAAGLQELLKCGHLGIEQLAPDWVFDSLFIPANCQPQSHLRRCLESFQTRPPTWLRLRSDQIHPMIRLLTQLQIETGSHPFIEPAVFIKGSKKCDLSQLPKVEAQDLASQCVGICCNPKPGEKWWDVCAGSGGKSLHLADLMQDNGLILATDIRPAILKQLRKRLKRNKYRSIKISLWDGAAGLPAACPQCYLPEAAAPARKAALNAAGGSLQAGPAPKTYFDGVLVDAPCSGLGTWSRNPDARWRTSAIQIRDYADIQKNLLRIAAGKVSPGGKLIYSTCTLTKAENTDIISRFLEEHREFHLEKIINPLNHHHTDGIIWIRPWEWNCNGMFIAVMRKD